MTVRHDLFMTFPDLYHRLSFGERAKYRVLVRQGWAPESALRVIEIER